MQFIKNFFNKTSGDKVVASLPWTSGLKGLDDISAIEFTTQQLNAGFKNNLFNNDQYLIALFAIDEKTHVHAEKITRHFVDINNIAIELEERMTHSAFLYHRQLFLIYFNLIEQLAALNHPCLARMLAHAIHHASCMIAWRYYNYHSAPANVWRQISQLHQTAINQDLQLEVVQLYSDVVPTSITTAYIEICMLGSLESLSFKRQQIDLVSNLLFKWATKITVDEVYDEKKHLFYIDTVTNAPAKRIRNFKPADTYRYWNFDAVNSKVDLCITSIECNIKPKQLSMDTFIGHPYFVSTLEVLRTEWSRSDYKRQRRTEERIKMTKSATTAYGFEDTCDQIKQYENMMVQRGEKAYQGSKSFEERLASHAVIKSRPDSNIIYVDLDAGYSNIVDESNKGLGLHISKQANEVSLGMMVSVTVREQKYGTRVGIIRSIKPISGNELHIGVEILSRSAFCVEAKNLRLSVIKATVNSRNLSSSDIFNQDKGVYASPSGSFTCLFLPEDYSTSNQETLIMPRVQYNKDDKFRVNILGADLVITPTKTFERFDDWIRIAYEQEFGQ